MQVSETTWDFSHAAGDLCRAFPDAEQRFLFGKPVADVNGASACRKEFLYRLSDFGEWRGFFEVAVD